MFSRLFLLSVLLIPLFLTACSNPRSELYEVKNEGVYYRAEQDISLGQGEFEIPGADPSTFRALSYPYAADKDRVYIQGKVIKGIDRNSFQILNSAHSYDKDQVYFVTQKIEGADPQTIKSVNLWTVKDGTAVYYRGGKVEGADPVSTTSFGPLEIYRFHDKDNRYECGLSAESCWPIEL